MTMLLQSMQTFPSVRIPSECGGPPVEVNLIAQLGIGEGSRMVRAVSSRQRAHEGYIDAHDEPSTKLGSVHLEHGDASSLYSFTVGLGGHPFHRHAGPRIFTAVSASSGTELRFCTASDEQVRMHSQCFIRAMRRVLIPPDCLFTVRFGGGTWHQFLPREASSGHPALFALSCHTNELGGGLSDAQRERVQQGVADIPSLTEVLPESWQAMLTPEALAGIPTTALSLHEAPQSVLAKLCALTRATAGRWGRGEASPGFLQHRITPRRVSEEGAPPLDSLVSQEFVEGFDHQDHFSLDFEAGQPGRGDARVWLERLLRGFVDNPPQGVTRLMAIRNLLVRPLRLRTSPLGCPVSSLISNHAPCRFAGFPVLGQRVHGAKIAEVLLGANDRHLQFRTSIRVEVLPDDVIRVSMSDRVRCLNAFGRLYMAAISATHRRYIAPTMLRAAVESATRDMLDDRGVELGCATR